MAIIAFELPDLEEIVSDLDDLAKSAKRLLDKASKSEIRPLQSNAYEMQGRSREWLRKFATDADQRLNSAEKQKKRPKPRIRVEEKNKNRPNPARKALEEEGE